MDFANLNNFRDYGGSKTTSGQKVKKGLLYRSDAICHLTPAEEEIITKKYQIKTVIDLRSQTEINLEPDPLIEGVQLLSLAPVAKLASMASENLTGTSKRKTSLELIKSGHFDSFLHMKDQMENLMRSFVNVPENRLVFQKLLHVYLKEENYAILQHCRGGKDRTGFASALILGILGVPESKIKEDYLLSNDYNANSIESKMQVYRSVTDDEELLLNLHEMLIVKSEYFDAALDEIKKLYGSFADFVTKGLEFSITDQNKLRKILLE
ncbi:tyrosine-protein phosphatase [Xylocopilactobacillus apicola]|uniref:Protein-tyrosine-phosphatase n=1 Tax=Xylocopilactobacillus apicola TaxID=2932184 RepID=A0AAU9DY50_9LACO|nr:tyrosine-protein phosphatase [Xylocopilactobacillus apicola]BDR59073.1 protein-tyrosine-phosphatase [Xylocopilactobacillus apicola]